MWARRLARPLWVAGMASQPVCAFQGLATSTRVASDSSQQPGPAQGSFPKDVKWGSPDLEAGEASLPA